MKTNLTAAQRDAWAEALESGTYTQCHGVLSRAANGAEEFDPRHGFTHCCIGVLACVLDVTGYPTALEPETSDTSDAFRVSSYLWTANDIDQKTFAEIAVMVRALEVVDA